MVVILQKHEPFGGEYVGGEWLVHTKSLVHHPIR